MTAEFVYINGLDGRVPPMVVADNQRPDISVGPERAFSVPRLPSWRST